MEELVLFGRFCPHPSIYEIENKIDVLGETPSMIMSFEGTKQQVMTFFIHVLINIVSWILADH